MFMSIHPYFNPRQTVLKYSENEIVDDISQIKHSIFNCVLNEMKVDGVEITSTADIPAGTGLGSSSAFTVGLLHTLACYKGKYYSKANLAEKACDIEINKLGSPIGKQDQYASAIGGLNFIRFNQNGTVTCEPILINRETYMKLQDNLILFYIGTTRSANVILEEQKKNMDDDTKTSKLLQMCDYAREMKAMLEKNDLSSFGGLLHENWLLKQSLASGISGSDVNALYEKAMNAGALGGKLLGAGGSGFLLFYCEAEKQERLRIALGLRQMEFSFDGDGTSVVYIGDKYWS